jgi:phospholipid/cholesterol/gamma-HCH transport system substrate-binding protein
MRSFRDMNPYVVGIVSVLLIGAITGAAFLVGLTHYLEHTYPVTAAFNDASGLRSGDAVKVAGVKVGRVTDVKADHNNGRVIVTLEVNNDVVVKDGASAEIALETLLGAKQVRLNDVTAGTTPLKDLPRDRRLIPIERNKTPYDIFELTRVATNGVEQTDTKALNDLINQFADITDGKHQSVTDLVDGLKKVGTAINQRDAELKQLLDRADTISATLAQKDQTLVALIDQSKKILDLLANRRTELATALGEGSAAVTQLAKIIGDHQVQLDEILSTLHPALDVVSANQANIDNALAWLGPAFYQQTKAGSHGPWLDLFIDSLGPDIVGILCNQFKPGQTCP